MSNRVVLGLAAGLAFALAASLAVAQAPRDAEKKPSKSQSLDKQLLDDLDRELLQDLPSGTKTTGPAPLQRGQEKTSPNAEFGAAGDSQNPLANIAQRMRSVESRIARHDTSGVTQHEQEQIVNQLDALLEQARQGGGKKKEGDKGNGSAQAGTGTGNTAAGPPRDSTNRIERGTKEQAETADVKDVLRRIWGHLPDKLRDEMQASLSEQFLPKYERLIEEYYKRLSEQRPDGR
jgi:hypothetical protein